MKVDQIEAIHQTIAFIESHLQEDISVADMAESAGYSVFHFIRLFNQVVHHTPYDYLMRRRLTESAVAMVSQDQRIIDVAQDFCFNNQETYSRMFRKMFKITPSQYRKTRVIPSFRFCVAKTLDDLLFINRYQGHSPQIEQFETINLRGLMTLLDPDSVSPTSQQQRGRRIFQEALKSELGTRYFEIVSRFNSTHHDQGWFIGAEEQFFDHFPAEMVSRQIPAGDFAKMEISAKDQQQAIRYLRSTWLPGMGHQTSSEMEITIRHNADWSELSPVSILLPISDDH